MQNILQMWAIIGWKTINRQRSDLLIEIVKEMI